MDHRWNKYELVPTPGHIFTRPRTASEIFVPFRSILDCSAHFEKIHCHFNFGIIAFIGVQGGVAIFPLCYMLLPPSKIFCSCLFFAKFFCYMFFWPKYFCYYMSDLSENNRFKIWCSMQPSTAV